jgi:hypothetical protein
MAVGVTVGVVAVRECGRCGALVADAAVAPDLGLVVREVRGVFLREELVRSLAQNLDQTLSAGHHVCESRSVLGAVEARRFAPPA